MSLYLTLTDGQLHFLLQGKSESPTDILWTGNSTAFPIPFEEWIDIEFYVKEGDDQSGGAGLPGEAKMKVKLPMNEDFAFILESFHYKLSAFLKGVFDIFARRVQEIYAFISEVLCVNGAYLGVCGLDLASRC